MAISAGGAPRQIFLVRNEEGAAPSAGDSWVSYRDADWQKPAVFRGVMYAMLFNFLLMLGVCAAWHGIRLLLLR
jgi:hypothetical protein